MHDIHLRPKQFLWYTFRTWPTVSVFRGVSCNVIQLDQDQVFPKIKLKYSTVTVLSYSLICRKNLIPWELSVFSLLEQNTCNSHLEGGEECLAHSFREFSTWKLAPCGYIMVYGADIIKPHNPWQLEGRA